MPDDTKISVDTKSSDANSIEASLNDGDLAAVTGGSVLLPAATPAKTVMKAGYEGGQAAVSALKAVASLQRTAALQWAMPELTRRRHPERQDCWLVMYGDGPYVTMLVKIPSRIIGGRRGPLWRRGPSWPDLSSFFPRWSGSEYVECRT